jgi:pyruvate dehydrogenase E2 component (dihydrolipoamide acetyltransferase)
MAKILEMPKLSPTMEEGVLSSWSKKEGDDIAVDDLLAEVETDKATMEFRAFDKGTLLKILVPAGANVKLGQPVAVVGAKGEDVSGFVAQAGSSAPAAEAKATQEAKPQASEPKAPPAEGAPQGASAKGSAQTQPPETIAPPAQRKPPVGNVLERTSYASEPPESGGGQPGGRVIASPYVRKTAREMGIDLQGAQGSGPGGRVLPADLKQLKPQNAGTLARVAAEPVSLRTPSAGDALAAPEVRPLSQMRKTIARRLTESKQSVPHFYLTIDVDAAELVKLRETINADLAAQSKPAPNGANGDAQPFKISLNDLVIKACAVALSHVPDCNASFSPEAILVHKRIDISVAVAIPDGLVTPVVRNADQKTVVAIAREVRDLASRARARKLKPEEMSDGTFSISNLGMFGIDEFAAVINPPEGAILAVGQVRKVPVVVDDTVVPGQRLTMTLSADHRVVDGAVGAAFLAELRRLIERPLRVLTG